MWQKVATMHQNAVCQQLRNNKKENSSASNVISMWQTKEPFRPAATSWLVRKQRKDLLCYALVTFSLLCSPALHFPHNHRWSHAGTVWWIVYVSHLHSQTSFKQSSKEINQSNPVSIRLQSIGMSWMPSNTDGITVCRFLQMHLCIQIITLMVDFFVCVCLFFFTVDRIQTQSVWADEPFRLYSSCYIDRMWRKQKKYSEKFPLVVKG